MGWKRNNSIGKQKLVTEKYLVGNFKKYYLLDSADIYQYESTKQVKNEIN